ncbi:kinase-like domain-containing protein [Mycena sp. CBHHK59/15]|nr:kinase-like domain-containing protein [Mycena sp. CBHHK59/15]
MESDARTIDNSNAVHIKYHPSLDPCRDEFDDSDYYLAEDYEAEADADDKMKCERLVYTILCEHPRIVKCLEPPLTLENAEAFVKQPMHFVKAPNGNVLQYLFAHPDVPRALRAKWGFQLAEGMAYVHSKGIVWADCSPTNILLTAELDLLLCDFGGAAIDGDIHMVAPPARYTDCDREPSIIFTAGREVDIFAFGCVFLEILTYDGNEFPPECPFNLHRGGLSPNGKDLLIDQVFWPDFKAIIENCWDLKYSDGGKIFDAVSSAYQAYLSQCESSA